MNDYDNISQYEYKQKRTFGALWKSESLEIPYNQRSYVWERENVEAFFNDLINHYNKKTSFLSYGEFWLSDINNTENYLVWDGQQRIITSGLLMYTFVKILKEYENDDQLIIKNKEIKRKIGYIESLIYKNDYTLSDLEKKKSEEGFNIPKIKLVNKNDDIILSDVFNDKIEDISICYSIKKNRYICKICNKDYATLKGLHRHLGVEKQTNNRETICNKELEPYSTILIPYRNNDDYINNKIINAYTLLYGLCKTELNNINELLQFIDMFLTKIPHEEKILKNTNAAAESYRLINFNKGQPLEVCDIIRNQLLQVIDNVNQEEFYIKFEKIINSVEYFTKINNKIDKYRIFNLLLSIVNKEYKDYENTEPILTIDKLTQKKQNLVINLYKKLEQTMITIQTIYDKINKHPLSFIYYNDFNWYTFAYIIIPIVIKYKPSNEDFSILLEIMVCYILSTSAGNRNFKIYVKTNSINFANDLFKTDITYQAMITKLKIMINKNFLKNINIATGMNREFSQKEHNQAINILFYYEYLNKPQGTSFLNMSEIDLEHIKPKNQDGSNFIGNLTLFESKNSSLILHRGNKSLKDEPYENKIVYYKESNIAITRKITEEYELWDDDTIEDRTCKILQIVIQNINKNLIM